MKRKLTKEEQGLWQKISADIHPLKPKSRIKIEAEKKTHRRSRAIESGADSSNSLASLPSAATRESEGSSTRRQETLIEGRMVGIDRRQAGRFKRGRMEIDGTLDLHGYTQKEAHRALLSFLTNAQKQGARCILIVTGKGTLNKGTSDREKGVLRSSLPRWLNEAPFRPLVLALEKARPQHGGDGAFYILLKKNK